MNRRVQLTIVSPAASSEEAAAIAAALEQFIRASAAPSTPASPAPTGAWRQAALAEGVTRAPTAPTPWE